MSYNRELETDKMAKQTSDKNLKAAAAERLKKNAEWKKRNQAK
jgi:hypothetical protein